jgi:hypothetical protein
MVSPWKLTLRINPPAGLSARFRSELHSSPQPERPGQRGAKLHNEFWAASRKTFLLDSFAAQNCRSACSVKRFGRWKHQLQRNGVQENLCGFRDFRKPRFICLAAMERQTFRSSSNQLYAVTSIPIDRAVPLMLFTAASIEAAFRSGIFCLAISSTCAYVTLPTLFLFGVPEPLARFAAFLSRTAAGGVLVTKVKLRST